MMPGARVRFGPPLRAEVSRRDYDVRREALQLVQKAQAKQHSPQLNFISLALQGPDPAQPAASEGTRSLHEQNGTDENNAGVRCGYNGVLPLYWHCIADTIVKLFFYGPLSRFE